MLICRNLTCLKVVRAFRQNYVHCSFQSDWTRLSALKLRPVMNMTKYGPDYEYVHMIMALTDEADTLSVADFGEVSDGVVSFSSPCNR